MEWYEKGKNDLIGKEELSDKEKKDLYKKYKNKTKNLNKNGKSKRS